MELSVELGHVLAAAITIITVGVASVLKMA